MSTLTGEEHSTILESETALGGYFRQFSKDPRKMCVGLEAEFFAVSKSTGKAVPYAGEGGVHDVLREMAAQSGYKPVVEGFYVIGLKKGDVAVALEPGGQVELSAPPVPDIFSIERQLRDFLADLRRASARFEDLRWLAVGIQPFSRLEEVPWVPKKRYELMSEYFSAHGTMSHRMMKLTATNQVNLDYSGEEQAMERLRTAFGITSIASAMFANSSFFSGKPSGFMSERLCIWNHTDPARTGLLTAFTRAGRTFGDYLDYILDMPMIFIIRDGFWIPMREKTFRRFIREGHEGWSATLGDFELHLSTAFPEVRFKQYLEVRGMDCQSPYLIPAVAAFWKGILYDDEASKQAWELVAYADEDARSRLHRDVPRMGLKAALGGRPILPMARELVEISRGGLRRQNRDRQMPDETVFLDRIEEKILRPGKSPAEVLLEDWAGRLKKNPGRLIEYLSVG